MPDETTAPALPMTFLPPPGWGMPSYEWQQDNQGVVLPADFRPTPDSPIAPFGWSFWSQTAPSTMPLTARTATIGATTPTSPSAGASVAGPRPGMAGILIGFGICLVGIVITVATYAAASGGGTYVVAWGAIGFGAFQGIKGIAQFVRG